MGGQKRKTSSGAPKWANQVKILLNDLFKLIKGTFHLLGLVLSDLKGGRGSTFCVVDFALITAFFSVDSPAPGAEIQSKLRQRPKRRAYCAYTKLFF